MRTLLEMLMIENQQVEMCSCLVERSFLGLERNKIALQNPLWKMNIYHEVVSNAVWIKHFVESLNLGLNSKLVNMFCDNKFAISLNKSEHKAPNANILM
jgi:hypothetical protein